MLWTLLRLPVQSPTSPVELEKVGLPGVGCRQKRDERSKEEFSSSASRIILTGSCSVNISVAMSRQFRSSSDIECTSKAGETRGSGLHHGLLPGIFLLGAGRTCRGNCGASQLCRGTNVIRQIACAIRFSALLRAARQTVRVIPSPARRV